LLARGAARIYAGSRDQAAARSLAKLDVHRVVPLELDITDPVQVQAAVCRAGDTNLLINNAGLCLFGGLLGVERLMAARAELETNCFGTVAMMQAFAPVLAAQGGGAMVNIISVTALVNFPALGSHSVSKAALHSATQCLRAELALQGIRVVGVYPGPVDNGRRDMAVDAIPAPQVVKAVIEALNEGNDEVFPDVIARQLRQDLARDPAGTAQRIAREMPAGGPEHSD
ncbi:MAG: SDR family NAD(P)-dependent oxidoreductase, partial [Candidatus Competibacteraceae bacterium]|nr:SDR family NAD(P)-dependent oxidoreductase [Candidatus Competibacteraceae bacterium]